MSYETFIRKHLQVESEMGDEWLCRCIFHVDSHASLCVNVRKGLFICYACGEKGPINKIERRVRAEAVPSTSSDDVRQRLGKLRATHEPVEYLSDETLRPFLRSSDRYKWWATRDIPKTVVDEWDLGYDPATRSATIPIRDLHGRLFGVIRRRTNAKPGEPRYIYPKGFKISLHLWGSWKAAVHPDASSLVIVEGSIDCLKVWSAGIPAVALLGSNIAPHQASLVRKLAPTRLYVMTDNDAAGEKAAAAIRSALGASVPRIVRVQYLGKDPGELTVQAIRQAFKSAQSNTARKASREAPVRLRVAFARHGE